MEALGGERRYSSYSFSTLALDEDEWSASRPGRAFTPGERTPSTHYTGGWMGHRAGLDTEARGKILCPRRGSNPDRPVVRPVIRHCTDWANPAHKIYCMGTKIRLFNTNVKFVLLYGCETWKETRDPEKKLQSYVNRCLRLILGIWWPNVISNEDLWVRTKKNEILKEIRYRKWKCIGYILRQGN
jgi:hypothetical protein